MTINAKIQSPAKVKRKGIIMNKLKREMIDHEMILWFVEEYYDLREGEAEIEKGEIVFEKNNQNVYLDIERFKTQMLFLNNNGYYEIIDWDQKKQDDLFMSYFPYKHMDF